MRKEQILIPLVRQVASRPRLAGATLGRLDPWGNPFTDEFLADPMVLADAMREGGPVVWHPLYQQWMVMGYDEAREVLGSPHVGTQNQLEVLLSVRPYTKLSTKTRTLLSNLLLLIDPPRHTRLRGLINRAFTPMQVSRLEPWMESLVDRLIGNFGDDVELMSDFAVRFPAMVIGELIGFEPDEWQWLQRMSASMTKVTDPVRSFDPVEIDDASDQLHERVLELVAKRRAHPTNDLLSALALAESEDADRLSAAELVSIASFIMVAGHETTSGMIGMGVLHLRERPDQIELLEQRPELWPNAVDELLRFDPALRTDPRTAIADFELAGHQIKKGQNIAVLTQLANRDFRRMDDADELRVDREDPAPLSFGHGIHYCLGASLARAEMRIALPPLLKALKDYDIDASAMKWRESISLRGPVSFPVKRRR